MILCSLGHPTCADITGPPSPPPPSHLECLLLKIKKWRRRGEKGYVCDAIFKLTDALGVF